MRILISGATGFIGSALVPFLHQHGHTVTRLVRYSALQNDVLWDPTSGELDPIAISDFDAVIHLAGANIAGKRWTRTYKREIWDSRIKSTELLVACMSESAKPSAVFICASASGYYGDRGDEILTEDSPAGTGFLAELCVAWERAAQPISVRGTRVVCLRTGMVLSPHGGALKKMLRPFRLGLGGRLGSGNQYWNWIALGDYLKAIEFNLTHDNLSGPVNMVSPNPMTNREFTSELAKALHRPAVLPVPALVLRAVFGEMADSLFFASQRVMPNKLLAAGFEFSMPLLQKVLRP